MNPRGGTPHRLSRPATHITEEPRTKSIVNYSLKMPPVDNDLLSSFREWLLQHVSEETARDYYGVVSRLEWPPTKRSHKRAWRKYIEFLAHHGLMDYMKKMTYLDFLKLGSSRTSKTQARIPDSVVLDIRRKLAELGLDYLFTLGLSGARLRHIITMLSSFKPYEEAKHPTGKFERRLTCFEDLGFCRYYLGIKLGKKRCDYIYYPLFKVKQVEIDYQHLKDIFHHHGIRFKLLRKWVEQQLTQLAHENNIPLDAVKLILSRGLSVSGIHYLNTRDWADRLFSIYVKWLKEVMSDAFLLEG